VSYERIKELIQAGTEKDDKVQAKEEEHTETIREAEQANLTIKKLEQRISSLEANLESKENTLNMCQKSSEEKDITILDVNHMVEKEQKEKAALTNQYSAKLSDQTEMNKTLQREIELLKQELDKQLETSTTLKNNLEIELKSEGEKRDTLAMERNQYEEACRKYEIEISERIRENLHIMEDYDKAKAVEHKQLNFINELTKSNQELNMSLRKLQSEFDNISGQLTITKSEVIEAKEHQESAFKQLDEEKKRNEDIESNLKSRDKHLDDRDKTVEKLNADLERSKASLEASKQNVQEVTSNRDNIMGKLENLEKEILAKDAISQEEINILMQRDKEQTELLNKLVTDLENMKEQSNVKTELSDRLQNELVELHKTSQFEYESLRYTSQSLEKQVIDLTNLAGTQDGKINALQNENRELNTRVINDVEVTEMLKLENGKLKSNLVQMSDREEKMQKQLDDLTKACEEKEKECLENQEKMELLEESVIKQDNVFDDITDQNDFLKSQIQDLEEENSQLKMNLGACVEKHEEEMSSLKQNHKQSTESVLQELQETRGKSQDEVNELLNNFNEVENELSFCQDELMNKTKELNGIRDQLGEMTNAALAKEQKLLKDLETLNEQNENILQSEIRKFKVECDEKVMSLQEKSNAEISKLQNEWQEKLTLLRKEHEAELEEQNQTAKMNLSDNVMMVSAEKEKYQEKFTRKAADYDRIRTEMDSKLKSKEVELSSKTRIIDQLGRRIETQQKLIDYMMKSLESERAKNSSSNSDVMMMLSNLQTTLDDRLLHQQSPLPDETFRFRSPLSSASSFQDLAAFVNSSPVPPLNSSPKREIYSSTSEPVISPIPSPIPSPMVEKVREDFNFYLRSSPTFDVKGHNQTYPSLKERTNFSTKRAEQNVEELQSKSLPAENMFIDLGYASPTLQNNTTKTVYFGEQIQTIMKTFEKLESLNEDTSPNKELNLEIWKQKIHFRLKVLEDQMNEIDTISNASSNASGSALNSSFERVPSLNDRSGDGKVIFHPSTQEIRDLIENVNRRYQKLGDKYITRVNTL